jgi:hypothetical protein
MQLEKTAKQIFSEVVGWANALAAPGTAACAQVAKFLADRTAEEATEFDRIAGLSLKARCATCQQRCPMPLI